MSNGLVSQHKKTAFKSMKAVLDVSGETVMNG
jgi:hypothetical protein